MRIKSFYTLLATATITFSTMMTPAFGDYGSGGSFPQTPLPKFPTTPGESAPAATTTPAPTPLPKKAPLPVMKRPVGLPGVVGVVNNEWQNSDYLGYLAHDIPVDVELLVGKNVPPIDGQALEKTIRAVLEKEGISNNPAQREGPVFPFIHFLILVYASDANRFVVFANFRLFEQVLVMRKGFNPAGYWQAITWEDQDVNLTDTSLLQTQVNSMAQKLATAFVTRYHDYNKDINRPEGETTPAL